VGKTDPEEWKRFIRRAAALYALIAYSHGGEGGVAGIDWAQRVLDTSDDTTLIDFAAAAEPGSEGFYLKQAWGAYGAAYRSQLFEIKIFDPSDDHELPLPSNMGERVAKAFEESAGKTASLFYDIIQRGNVDPGRTERTRVARSFGDRIHEHRAGPLSRYPAETC